MGVVAHAGTFGQETRQRHGMNESLDDLQVSYGRCLRNGHFIARFYEIFLDSHPDVQAMFAKTDFSKQHMVLRRGISSALAHAGGSRLAQRTMEQMAKAHSRHGRTPVASALYPYWIDSLLRAIAEHDPEHTAALDQRWRLAMNQVTDYFVAND